MDFRKKVVLLMELITKEQLKSMEIGELMIYLDTLKGEMAKHPYYIIHEELPSTFKYRNEIGIDVLRDYFEIDQETRTYKFPMLNEQKGYKGIDFLGHASIPPKGFFWNTKVTVKEMEFGLMKITFELIKIGPGTDLMYLSDRTVLKQEYPFYFDFDQKTYVHPGKKNKDSLEEYERRMELYSCLLEKLEEDNDIYRTNLEVAAKIIGVHTNFTETRVKNLAKLFRCYLDFANDNLKYLSIKLMLAQITQEHYMELKKHLHKLQMQVEQHLGYLLEFELVNVTSIVDRYDVFDTNLKEKAELIEKFRNDLVKMFRHRDVEDTFFKKEDGFYDFNELRLFENVVQIEIEASLAKTNERRFARDKAKQDLLEELRKKADKKPK